MAGEDDFEFSTTPDATPPTGKAASGRPLRSRLLRDRASAPVTPAYDQEVDAHETQKALQQQETGQREIPGMTPVTPTKRIDPDRAFHARFLQNPVTRELFAEQIDTQTREDEAWERVEKQRRSEEESYRKKAAADAAEMADNRLEQERDRHNAQMKLDAARNDREVIDDPDNPGYLRNVYSTEEWKAKKKVEEAEAQAAAEKKRRSALQSQVVDRRTSLNAAKPNTPLTETEEEKRIEARNQAVTAWAGLKAQELDKIRGEERKVEGTGFLGMFAEKEKTDAAREAEKEHARVREISRDPSFATEADLAEALSDEQRQMFAEVELSRKAREESMKIDSEAQKWAKLDVAMDAGLATPDEVEEALKTGVVPEKFLSGELPSPQNALPGSVQPFSSTSLPINFDKDGKVKFTDVASQVTSESWGRQTNAEAFSQDARLAYEEAAASKTQLEELQAEVQSETESIQEWIAENKGKPGTGDELDRINAELAQKEEKLRELNATAELQAEKTNASIQAYQDKARQASLAVNTSRQKSINATSATPVPSKDVVFEKLPPRNEIVVTEDDDGFNSAALIEGANERVSRVKVGDKNVGWVEVDTSGANDVEVMIVENDAVRDIAYSWNGPIKVIEPIDDIKARLAAFEEDDTPGGKALANIARRDLEAALQGKPSPSKKGDYTITPDQLVSMEFEIDEVRSLIGDEMINSGAQKYIEDYNAGKITKEVGQAGFNAELAKAQSKYADKQNAIVENLAVLRDAANNGGGDLNKVVELYQRAGVALKPVEAPKDFAKKWTETNVPGREPRYADMVEAFTEYNATYGDQPYYNVVEFEEAANAVYAMGVMEENLRNRITIHEFGRNRNYEGEPLTFEEEMKVDEDMAIAIENSGGWGELVFKETPTRFAAGLLRGGFGLKGAIELGHTARGVLGEDAFSRIADIPMDGLRLQAEQWGILGDDIYIKEDITKGAELTPRQLQRVLELRVTQAKASKLNKDGSIADKALGLLTLGATVDGPRIDELQTHLDTVRLQLRGDIENNPLAKAFRLWDQMVTDRTDPKYDKSYLGKLAEGAGSMTQFLLAGGAASMGKNAILKGATNRATGLSKLKSLTELRAMGVSATTAVQGALFNTSEGVSYVQDWYRNNPNISDDDIGMRDSLIVLAHAAVGTTEALPIERLVKRVNFAKVMPDTKKAIMNLLVGGVAEGAQEGFMVVANSIIQDAVLADTDKQQALEGLLGEYNYKISEALGDMTGEEAQIGAVLGAFMDAFVSGAAMRRSRRVKQIYESNMAQAEQTNTLLFEQAKSKDEAGPLLKGFMGKDAPIPTADEIQAGKELVGDAEEAASTIDSQIKIAEQQLEAARTEYGWDSPQAHEASAVLFRSVESKATYGIEQLANAVEAARETTQGVSTAEADIASAEKQMEARLEEANSPPPTPSPGLPGQLAREQATSWGPEKMKQAKQAEKVMLEAQGAKMRYEQASAAAKIAQGRSASLTASETESLKGTTFESSLGNMPVKVTPATENVSGVPIVTKPTTDWMEKNAPSARKLVRMTESEATKRANEGTLGTLPMPDVPEVRFQKEREILNEQKRTFNQEREEMSTDIDQGVASLPAFVPSTQFGTPALPERSEDRKLRSMASDLVRDAADETAIFDAKIPLERRQAIAAEVIGQIANRVRELGAVFPTMKVNGKGEGGSAAVTAEGELIINPVNLSQIAIAHIARGSTVEAAIEETLAIIRHEQIHLAITASLENREEGERIWEALPEDIKQRVLIGYFNRKYNDVVLRRGGDPLDMTPDDWMTSQHPEAKRAREQSDDSYYMAQEYFRMLVQIEDSGEVDEALLPSKGQLTLKILEILEKLADYLTRSLARLKQENNQLYQDITLIRDNALSLIKDIGTGTVENYRRKPDPETATQSAADRSDGMLDTPAKRVEEAQSMGVHQVVAGRYRDTGIPVSDLLNASFSGVVQAAQTNTPTSEWLGAATDAADAAIRKLIRSNKRNDYPFNSIPSLSQEQSIEEKMATTEAAETEGDALDVGDKLILEAIDQLPVRQSQVSRMTFDGMSPADIAADMGISEKAVKNILDAATKRLRTTTERAERLRSNLQEPHSVSGAVNPSKGIQNPDFIEPGIGATLKSQWGSPDNQLTWSENAQGATVTSLQSDGNGAAMLQWLRSRVPEGLPITVENAEGPFWNQALEAGLVTELESQPELATGDRKDPMQWASDRISDLEDAASDKTQETTQEASDRDYLAAVGRGDMDAAQKMVDEAAKAAGYGIGPVFHGTINGKFNSFARPEDLDSPFSPGGYFYNQFQEERAAGNLEFDSSDTTLLGVWFTEREAIAEGFAGVYYTDQEAKDSKERLGMENTARLFKTYLNLKNPKVYRTIQDVVDDLAGLKDATELRKKLQSKGYDGAVVTESQTDAGYVDGDMTPRADWVAFNPNQIKSAEPVTRDAQGNIIPLSQRFNQESDSIQYASDRDMGDAPMSAINVLYNDSPDLPKPNSKVKNSKVAALLEDIVSAYWGEKITSDNITPEQMEAIISMGMDEFKAALDAGDRSASNWYSTSIEAAMAVANVLHPELNSAEAAAKAPGFKDASNPREAADLVMRIALAVTSQNLTVEQNVISAEEQFDIFKRTGRFDPTIKYGEKAPSISSNLRLANDMINARGFSEVKEISGTPFTVAELTALAKEITGRKVTVTGKLGDTVMGTAVFGPKIGQGFLQNIMQNFDPVTIDLWMRRTWGRWTGDVLGSGVTDERLAKLLDAMREYGMDLGPLKGIRVVNRKRKNGNNFRSVSDSVIDRLETDYDFANLVFEAAKEVESQGQETYRLSKRPTTRETLDGLEDGTVTHKQFIREQRRNQAHLERDFKKAREQKKVGKGKEFANKSDFRDQWYIDRGFTELHPDPTGFKPKWMRAAAAIKDSLNPVDIPSPRDREVISQVVNEITRRLKEGGYPETTNADVQAVLWYPEKDLWAKLRGEEESNLKSTYDEQFIRIAESRGLGQQARDAAASITGGAAGAARTDTGNDGRAEQSVRGGSVQTDGVQEASDRGVTDLSSIIDEMNDMDVVNTHVNIGGRTAGTSIDVKGLNSRLDYPLAEIDLKDYEGIPVIFTITDQLGSGRIMNPFTGQLIKRLNGGIGFNGTKGNADSAWANTDEKTANALIRDATNLYQRNKEFFEKLWADGSLPNGQVPLAVVKMGVEGIKSNEAIFRVAIDNLKQFPQANLDNAFRVLKSEMESLIEKGSKPRASTAAKNLNKKAKVALGLLNSHPDLITALQNIESISIGNRVPITDRILYGGIGTKPGVGSTPVTVALSEGVPDALAMSVQKGVIVGLVEEKALKDVPERHVVALQGVDVLNPGVTYPNHPNYPYGVKGGSIGIIKNPPHMADAFGEAYGSVLGKLSQAERKNEFINEGDVINYGLSVGQGLPQSMLKGSAVNKISDIDKLNGLMRSAFPRVQFSTDSRSFDIAVNNPGTKRYKKDGDTIYGVTQGGNIYLNPTEKTMNTSFHEMGHLWIDFIKNPEQDAMGRELSGDITSKKYRNKGKVILSQGLKLVEGTTELADAIAEYGDTGLAREEALVKVMAKRGETIVDAAQKANFQEWLLTAFKYIAERFKSMLSMYQKDIKKLTLNQFVDGMIADIMAGQRVSDQSFAKPTQTATQEASDRGVDDLGFYSALESVVEEKMPRAATAQQVRGILNPAKNPVKKAELDWMGLDVWLDDQDGKIEKDALLQFIRENAVRLEEVTKGGDRDFKFTTSNGETVTVKVQGEQAKVINGRGDEETVYLSPDADMFSYEDDEGTVTGDWPEGDNDALVDRIFKHFRSGELNAPPRHQRLTLKGGENYREVLLMMPEKPNIGTGENIKISRVGRAGLEGELVGVFGQNGEVLGVGDTEQEAMENAKKSSLLKDESKVRPNFYKEEHFDEPNIVVHMRVDDRVDADGNKTLFVQEIQSDWASAINEYGVRDYAEISQLEKQFKEISQQSVSINEEIDSITLNFRRRFNETPLREHLAQRRSVLDRNPTADEQDIPNPTTDPDSYFQEWYLGGSGPQAVEYREKVSPLYKKLEPVQNEARDLQSRIRNAKEGVSNMPFAKSYHELALKRLLRMATEGGYDKLAWTTGKQQIDLYTEMLRQNVDEISWEKFPASESGKQVVMLRASKGGQSLFEGKSLIEGKNPINGERTDGKTLDQIVGKTNADQIRESKDEEGTIKGDNLSIGGHFHKTMYDTMVPSFLKKYTKKWGGRVGESSGLHPSNEKLPLKIISAGSKFEIADANGSVILGPFDRKTAERELLKASPIQPSLEITPAMKESLPKGQALFASDRDYLSAVNEGDLETAQRMVDDAAKAAGYDSPKVYHGSRDFKGDAFNREFLGRFSGVSRGGFNFTERKDIADAYSAAKLSDDQMQIDEVVAAFNKAKNAVSLSPAEVEAFDSDTGWDWELLEMSDRVAEMDDIENAIFTVAPWLEGNGYASQAKAMRGSISAQADTATPRVISAYLKDARKVKHERTGDTIYVADQPNQIKSADPVTYDADGNVIPLSKRFNEESDSIQYAGERENFERHAELEAKHAAGTITTEETAEAQRLVDERAKAAGYPVKAWHGSTSNTSRKLKEGLPFDVFRNRELGFHFGTEEQARSRSGIKRGFKGMAQVFLKSPIGNVSDNYNFSKARARVVLQAATRGADFTTLNNQAQQDNFKSIASIIEGFPMDDGLEFSKTDLSKKNALEVARIDAINNHINSDEDAANLITEALGFETLQYQNAVEGDEVDFSYVALHPENIKSAEPFTGTPLEQRFDETSDSIQYAGERDYAVSDEQKEKARKQGFVPEVRYHGSGATDITSFRKDKLGTTTGAGSATLGFFFAEHPSTSQSYTGGNPSWAAAKDGLGMGLFGDDPLAFTHLNYDEDYDGDNEDGPPVVFWTEEAWEQSTPDFAQVALILQKDGWLDSVNTLDLDGIYAELDELKNVTPKKKRITRNGVLNEFKKDALKLVDEMGFGAFEKWVKEGKDPSLRAGHEFLVEDINEAGGVDAYKEERFRDEQSKEESGFRASSQLHNQINELSDEGYAKLKSLVEDVISAREYEYDSATHGESSLSGYAIPSDYSPENLIQTYTEKESSFIATGFNGEYEIKKDNKDWTISFNGNVINAAPSKDYAKEIALDHAQQSLDDSFSPSEGKIYEVFLKEENPMVYDYKGEAYREKSYYDVISEAKKKGHDSVILKNTYDGGGLDNIHIVFEPNQIKSVDAESFNPESDLILESGDRGWDFDNSGWLTGDSAEDAAKIEKEFDSSVDFAKWLEGLERRAMEKPGEYTQGVPRLANPGKDEETRSAISVVQFVYDRERKREEYSDWAKQAKKLADSTPGIVRDAILNAAYYGKAIGEPVMEIAAGIIVEREMKKATRTGTKEAKASAVALSKAHLTTRTNLARAMAAGVDRTRTPEERSAQMIAGFMVVPETSRARTKRAGVEINRLRHAGNVKDKHREISNATNPQEKARLQGELDRLMEELDDAKKYAEKQEKQTAKLEKVLATFGVTLRDVFDNAAVKQAKTDPAVGQALATFTGKDRKIAEMLLKRMPSKRIQKQHKVPRDRVEKVYADLRTALAEKHSPAVQSMAERADIPNPKDESLTADEFVNALLPPLEVIDKNRWAGKDGNNDFDMANPDDAGRIARIISVFMGGGASNVVHEMFIMAILSGPQTHAVNIASNTLALGWDATIQRSVESAVNLMLPEFGRQKNTRQEAAQFGEIPRLWRGFLRGFQPGLKFAQRAWSTEKEGWFKSWALNAEVSQSFDEGKVESHMPAIPDKVFGVGTHGGRDVATAAMAALMGKDYHGVSVGGTVRIPGRALGAADELFKSVIGHGEVAAMAYRIAKAEVKVGQLTKEKMEDRIAELMLETGSVAWELAAARSDELTFTNSFDPEAGSLDKLMYSVQKFKTGRVLGSEMALVKLLVSFYLPFLRTPTRILQIGIRKSPLGAFNLIFKMLKAGIANYTEDGQLTTNSNYGQQGRRELVRDLAEQAIAWTAFHLFRGMVEGDPDDEEKEVLLIGSRPFEHGTHGERKRVERLYGTDAAVRIGGRDGVVVPYGRYEPISTSLMLMADIARTSKNYDTTQDANRAMGELWGYFANNISNKTFLQGIDKFNTVVSMAQTESGKAKLLKEGPINFLRSFVPNAFRQPARELDDTPREYNSGNLYKLTGLGKFGIGKVDLYGRPVEKSMQDVPQPFRGLGRLLFRTPLGTHELHPGDQFMSRVAAFQPKLVEKLPTQYGGGTTYKYKVNGENVDMKPEEKLEFQKLTGQLFSDKVYGWENGLQGTGTEVEVEDEIKEFKSLLTKSRAEAKDILFKNGIYIGS